MKYLKQEVERLEEIYKHYPPTKEGLEQLAEYKSILNLNELDKVTRLEVIDRKGRSYINNNVNVLTYEFQDNNKTLKLFIV